MKKILSVLAVAFVMASTSAMAADKIQLGLGGFMKQYVGVINHDAPNVNDNAQWSNTEIHFTGATVLDNGLKVAVRVELEGDRGNNGNDISSLTLSSDTVGAFTVGATSHAVYDYAVRAPRVGTVEFYEVTDWASFTTTRSANNIDGPSAIGNKGNKVKYASPTFNGLTAYTSYDFNENTASNAKRNMATEAEAYSVGVNYNTTYASGFSVNSDLATFRPNGGVENNRAGLSVGYSGFTVGGAYTMFNDDTAGNTGGKDGNGWELGVGYETGPWTVTAAYAISKSDGTATAGSNEDKTLLLGAGYDLGAGVSLTGNYFDANYNPEGAGRSGEASGMIAGIEVAF